MRVWWTLLGISAAGCSLFTSLDGLSDGADAGSSSDAALPSDSSSTSDASDSSIKPCDGGSCDAGCTGLPGPTMLTIGSACIDSTEVTYAQYKDFLTALASSGTTVAQPAECAWNTSFAPDQAFTDSDLAYPVAWVDWCDAHAYCAWAGKELCADFDGDASTGNDWKNPAVSVWMSACSKGGAQPYSYGNSYQANVCDLEQGDAASSALPAGSLATCVGGYPGLFDMIGNIKEWESWCVAGPDSAQDLCRRRGAGFDEVDDPARSCAWDEADTRNHTSATSGFRCCKRP